MNFARAEGIRTDLNQINYTITKLMQGDIVTKKKCLFLFPSVS